MIKHFRIDVEKFFLSFHRRTIMVVCKVFTILICKFDMKQKCNKNGIFCAILITVGRFGNKMFSVN